MYPTIDIHSTEIMKDAFFKFLFCCFCLGITINGFAQTASETAACAPVSIAFTAPDNATSFFWDFKDGATSSDANPTNTFVQPGTYEVDFSNEQGGTVVGTVVINVFEKPTLSFAQDPEVGCTPANVVLTNTTNIPDGINLLKTTWVFPDGNSAVGNSTDKDYAIAGQYGVTISIETSGTNCDASQEFQDAINIVASPIPAFTISPSATACEGPHEVVIGNDTEGNDLTYFWDLGNGNTSSEENPPNQTYQTGNYTVSLMVTNENGCTNTTSQLISIGLPVASFEIADTVCAGDTIPINNLSSAGSYQWTLSGAVNTSLSGTSPTYHFPVGGVYNINLNVIAQGGECTKDTTITVFAQEVNAVFTANPIYGCSEPMAVAFTPNFPIEGATYGWDFGDDSTGMEQNPTHDYYADNESPYHENGEFKFNPTLTMTTSVGCTAEFETEVVLDIPLARFMPDTVSGCAPLTVEFSDSSRSTQPITNWEWIYADGNTANFGSADAHSYTYTEPGDYDVQLVITNNLGCPDTSFVIRVEVGERIAPDFGTDKTSVCQGEAIQFTDASNNPNIDEWHYYTDNGRSSHCFSEANPIIPFETETGAFEVQMVVGYNGCLDSITKSNFIEVKGPIADIDWMMNCETPNTVMFTSASGDATTLNWDFGDNSTGTAEAETHDYASTGDYSVRLTAENPSTGCPASSTTELIQIRNVKADGPVEMLQCKGQPVMLNSEASVDYDTSCFRGFTWFFNEPSMRPVTTSKFTVDDISYRDTGMYVIDLVVEDVNGCTDTASYPIIVHEAMVTFDIDKTEVCSPQSIQISNVVATTTSEKIETYMWDFGDGAGMSEEENPGSYTYSFDPGQDQITVSVSIEDDAGCPGGDQKVIDFYRPQSNIIAGDLTICAGESVSVRATPFTRDGQNRPLTYNWSLGNGQSANTETAEATFAEGGIYTISLDYEETATGCGGSEEVIVNVQDFPMAGFTSNVDDQAELCAPSIVTFTDASGSLVPLSQSWDFGNGGSGVGASVDAAYQPGDFTVRLVVQTSNGCDDETTRDFAFAEGPNAAIQLSGTNFCVGDMVTATITDTMNVRGFSWEFEGTTFGENEESVQVIVSQVPLGGEAPIKLNLDGIGECNTTVFENIQVNNVMANFEAFVDECETSVRFNNISIGADNSMWEFGDGSTSNEDRPTHVYSEAGSYTVTLTVVDDATNCTNMSMQTITVGAANTEGSLTLTPGPCNKVNIEVSPAFAAAFPNLSFDYGGTGEADNGGLGFAYTNPGTYTISLIGSTDNGCTSNEITGQVTVANLVEGGETPIYVPNVFTPDVTLRDSVNNILTVSKFPLNGVSGCDIEEVASFEIYNRWGKKVYANNAPFSVVRGASGQPGWNGTDRATGAGDPAAFDYSALVYRYVIEVKYIGGGEGVLKGNVTLIR